MERPQTSGIKDTPLTWAIRSMRRRRRMGQVKFTKLVLGRYVTGAVSRWESGQIVPSTKNLLRLLRLAEVSEERSPILQALKARGIDEVGVETELHLPSRRGTILVLQDDGIAPGSAEATSACGGDNLGGQQSTSRTLVEPGLRTASRTPRDNRMTTSIGLEQGNG